MVIHLWQDRLPREQQNVFLLCKGNNYMPKLNCGRSASACEYVDMWTCQNYVYFLYKPLSFFAIIELFKVYFPENKDKFVLLENRVPHTSMKSIDPPQINEKVKFILMASTLTKDCIYVYTYTCPPLHQDLPLFVEQCILIERSTVCHLPSKATNKTKKETMNLRT